LGKIILILVHLFALLRAIFVSMSLIIEDIKRIAAAAAESNNLFLVDISVRGRSGAKIIEIFIDGESDVSADDCAKVSREINSQLEQLPDSKSIFRLDVSSPGVDRPLKFLKQFPKHINRKMEVAYFQEGQLKKITGTLLRIEGESPVFMFKNSETKINFNDIKEAKVIVSFS
jgi:ribosome maturation factor RimP